MFICNKNPYPLSDRLIHLFVSSAIVCLPPDL
jgi:hypothetical protein